MRGKVPRHNIYPSLIAVRTYFDRSVLLLVQAAWTFRHGRTFVSWASFCPVSGLGRDAPNGIWATPRPLDLGHGGIRRAEVSAMSVGRFVATVAGRVNLMGRWWTASN